MRQQSLFMGVQAGAQCDVLVAPLEADEPSVDRVARSLMTRMLAVEIAGRGLCVADPTLAARVLGVNRRRLDDRAVWQLAAAMSHAGSCAAKWCWRHRSGASLSPLLRSSGRDTVGCRRHRGTGGRWLSPTRCPPEAAFAPGVAAMADRLMLAPSQPAAPPEAGTPTPDSLPEFPANLAQDPGTPQLRALRLQLVAATYPPQDTAGEHLWKRSVIALRGLEDETARVLRARAALHLHRRPYAIQLLDGLNSFEAQAMRAAAQGDLPQLEAAPGARRDSAFSLVTRTEAERLRAVYGKSAGFEDRRRVALETHSPYAPLLHAALAPEQASSPEAASMAQSALDHLGVSVQTSVWSHLLGVAQAVGWLALELAGARWQDVERSYAPLWRARAAQWRTQRAQDRLAEWDVYDALYAINRAGVVTTAATLTSRQARPRQALVFSRALAAQFGGHPALTAWLARAQDAPMQAEASGSGGGLDAQRGRRLAREVDAWEEGESGAVRILAQLNPRVRYRDEPPREWRRAPGDEDGIAPPREARVLLERQLAHFQRALDYTQSEFRYLDRAQSLLRDLGHEAEAQRLVMVNQGRFVGDPARERFLLAHADESGDVGALTAALQERLRGDPQAWETRMQLARAQLRARDPTAAQQTLLGDPLLVSGRAPAVELSNRAHDAAWVLQSVGETERAAALFRRAADAGTGSALEMHSAQHLAQASGDFHAARTWAQKAYERYRSASALSDAAYYAFLTGDTEAGWRAFYEASRVAPDRQPWSAAIAGHRIAASATDDIVKFAQLWKGVSGKPQLDAQLKEHFVFNYAFVDRAPGEAALQLLASFGGKSGDRAFQLMGEGYAAWLKGDYARAAELLHEPNTALVTASASLRRPVAYPLPYMVSALIWAERAPEAHAVLDAFRDKVGRDFYYLLARAYVEGLAGRREAALDLLWQAMLSRPAFDTQAIPPGFQLLEACEKLFEITGQGAYRDLPLDLARRQQHIWPDSWAFAFEARHAQDAAARQRAVAIALYLDPQSQRLRAIPDAERKRAQQWVAQNKPFAEPTSAQN